MRIMNYAKFILTPPPQKVEVKGFTLAEVLITLAIIGIIAAITIPSIVANHQKRELETRFAKAYRTANQAVNLSSVNHGSIENWEWKDVYTDEEKNELVKKYFLPYLNVVKFCPIGTTGCFPNQAYTGLNGTASHTYGDGKNPTALLADGTSINFAIFPNYYSNNKKTLAMDIDTNGFRKPNVIGRDMFAINIYPATGELLPHGINNDGSSLNENGDYEKYTLDEIINTGGAHACNPNNLGWFCGARIILEGFKMNY